MGTDLTGGLNDEREYVFAEQPDNPEMRESVNAWIWDNGQDFGMPRIGIEALADQWETHEIQMNIVLGDGRAFNLYDLGEVHDPLGADGKPRILGAGPLSFELIEPFHRWRVRFDGLAVETSTKAQIDGWSRRESGGPLVPIDFEIDIRSAVPPWEAGTLLEEAGRVLATQEEGDLMGGPRFEQLSRATGRFRVGDEAYVLDGGALRVRRQGVRRLARFRGHVWQSAIFPSGRGFGLCVYPPRTDGKATFNEGYLFDGGSSLVPARVVNAPWLRTLQANGEDVSVVLETEDGITTIRGETLLSAFAVLDPSTGRRLQQAIVRYTFDGETANGMLERSYPDDQLGRP